MTVIAYQASWPDAVLLEEDPGMPGVFAGYNVCILQHLESAKGDILEVTDRSSNEIEQIDSALKLWILTPNGEMWEFMNTGNAEFVIPNS